MEDEELPTALGRLEREGEGKRERERLYYNVSLNPPVTGSLVRSLWTHAFGLSLSLQRLTENVFLVLIIFHPTETVM